MANPSKVLGVVRDIQSYGDGVYEVVFQVPVRTTRFFPGQFLHLTLEEFDPTTGYWPESRVFSIASEPRQDQVTVVYSVKGAYTQRMERELVVGKSVWLKYPYGDFVIDVGLLNEDPLALIAGGTGVSPFLPFLKTCPVDLQGDVHLFYGIRTPQHLLFRRDLESLKTRSWFHLHLMVEDGAVEGLPFEKGRLSIDHVIGSMGKSVGLTNYFLSGPPGMIQRFKTDLTARAVAGSHIHIDEWE